MLPEDDSLLKTGNHQSRERIRSHLTLFHSNWIRYQVIPYKDLQPSRRFPIVTVLLIAINVGIFLYQVFLPEKAAIRFIYQYAVIPYEFKIGHNISASPGLPFVYSPLTAMFLHGGWLHLIGNMLYLWIFGDNIEESMGSFRYLIFYLLCGLIATFAQIYANFDSVIPALGASGAIAGILAAYLRLFPKARIAVLIPVFIFLRSIILPAWLVLGFWILLQILSVQSRMSQVGHESGGVAYFAHIGGFVAGLLLMPLFIRRDKGKRGKST